MLIVKFTKAGLAQIQKDYVARSRNLKQITAYNWGP